MKVTQEKLPASQIGLEIEITPDMSKKAYEQVIQKYTRTVDIPGFRKGKVPRQVLVQRFGTLHLKAAALEDLIDDSLKAALEQEKIEALGNFQLRSSFEDLVQKYDPGQPLTFSAAVDVQPEATLKEYQNLKLQAEEVAFNPERVDDVLKNYQEQNATLIPVEDRSAKMGDVAVVDFKGVIVSEDPAVEPQPVPGGEATGFQVELAPGKFIEGFVDGMVGMQLGETKEVQAQFPDTYPQSNLAGKAAVFTVTLKELKEKELPELDDEFAQDVSEFETLAELRESLEKEFTQEAETRTKTNKEQAILNVLLDKIEVELPETLIDREVNYMLSQTAMQLEEQGMDVRQFFNQDTIPMLKERSRPDAINRIKRTLALGEVAKQQSIQVSPEDVSAKVDDMLSRLDPAEQQGIDRDRLQSVIAEDLLKEKIIDWLIEQSDIELVPEGTLKSAETESEEESSPELAAEPALDTTETESAVEAESPATSQTIEVTATPVTEPTEETSEIAENSETEEKSDGKGKSSKSRKSKSKSAQDEAPTGES